MATIIHINEYDDAEDLPAVATPQLRHVDLFDARIVSGGGPYLKCRTDLGGKDISQWLHTAEDVAGESLFEGVWRLSQIILPETTSEIKDYVFFRRCQPERFLLCPRTCCIHRQ